MKKLFLTGGTGGIGFAIKEIFEQNGYIVISPTKDELNLDLAINENFCEYFKNNKQELKDISTFIHCAGYNRPAQINAFLGDGLLTHMSVNFITFATIVKTLLPYMKENNYGKILGISSLFGTITKSGRSMYTASKHAMNGFIKTLAVEGGQDNILANSLSPGFINTEMTRKNNNIEQIKKIEEKIPMRRLGTPKEIARVAYFLCSEYNTYITGQNIICDGGYMVNG